jgi:CheY-like chemotaxis protein
MAHILLIDDDPTVREALSRMLTAVGHGVAEAEDGEAGIAKFAAGMYDVVIADIFMPGEDGIGTIRRIRDQDPFLGIVAISEGRACAQYDVLRISVELGADFGLPKPVSTARLLATVAKAEGCRRLRCA